MWNKVEENEEIETASTTNTRNNMLSPKATIFSEELQDIGIVPKENKVPNEESDNINEHIINSTHLQRGWGCRPGNSTFNLNDECITKLIELHDRGKGKSNNSHRVTAERAYDILRNENIPNN